MKITEILQSPKLAIAESISVNFELFLEDAFKILDIHESNEWIVLPEDKFKGKPSLEERGFKVLYSPLFFETVNKKVAAFPALQNEIQKFIEIKKADPIAPFNSSDKSLSPEGNLARAVPKLRKSHILNNNLSIVYIIEGSSPILLKLFGVFSHDELGTGQPANIKRQKQMGSVLKHQVFGTSP